MSANHRTHASSQKPVHGYIPIRPDLLQFVLWRENLPEKTSPLCLPGQGAICNYLSDLMQFARATYSPLFSVEREPLALTGLTARLYFECSPGFVDESFFQYADLIAQSFNDFLHQHWKEVVDIWATACLYYDPKHHRKEAIADLHTLSRMGDLREWESDIRADHRFRAHRGTIARPRVKQMSE